MPISPAQADEAYMLETLHALKIADTQTDAVRRLRALLRQTVRVAICDGRVFLGTFAGTDKQLNVLLLNADEFRFAPPRHANPDGRYVGLVLVPWRLVVRVEAAKAAEEREVDVDPGVGYRGIAENYEDAEDGLYT